MQDTKKNGIATTIKKITMEYMIFTITFFICPNDLTCASRTCRLLPS